MRQARVGELRGSGPGLGGELRRSSPGIVAAAVSLVLGCSSPLEVEVRLVDPCDQAAVEAVDFVRLEPRGTGIDSGALGTIEHRSTLEAPPIEVPVAPDFQILASGHRDAFDAPAAAIGLSSPVDLTEADRRIEILVPFSLLGQFHRTTLMSAPEASGGCSALGQDRFGATATLLPGGEVLIVGGARYTSDGFLEYVLLVEVYDPKTGAFVASSPGDGRPWVLGSGQARRNHSASLLPDGRVLIAGGQAPDPERVGTEEALQSAFFIDPRDPTRIRIPGGGVALVEARTGHEAAVLDEGRLLLIGGRQLSSDGGSLAPTYLDTVEYFDLEEGIFQRAIESTGGDLRLSAPRSGHSATTIPGSSSVLVAGGMNEAGPVLEVEVLRFSEAGPRGARVDAGMLGVGPIHHAAAQVREGGVLLSGGYRRVADVTESWPPVNSVDAVELWVLDGATGGARPACSSSLAAPRGFHTASVLGGRAVFIGGRDPEGRPRADAEAVDLLPAETWVESRGGRCFGEIPTLLPTERPRAEHEAVSLTGSREVLVLGGIERDPAVEAPAGVSISTAEIYSDYARRALAAEPQGR